MRVLMAAMKWDYGFRDRGLSFEYTNLYDAMRHMDGVEVELFDFMEAFQSGGQMHVAAALDAAILDFDPDLLFTILFKDEIPPDVLVNLRDRPRPITFNWFCDDHWRFEDFTRRYAPLFNACSTTATSALPKYRRLGYSHVIKTQWACNHHLYRPTGRPTQWDVTFVGQPHGNRAAVLTALRARGLEVETWGTGWPNGRLSQDDMIAVFSESRINLNLSNSSVRSRLSRWLGRPALDQIKGRNFEIPGCGGFQLSGNADDIETYYEPDREIVLFHDTDGLGEAVRHYLRDDAARCRIAEAGYRRTISEHTYAHRFYEIFKFVDLA